jgi:hypothetical protein
MDARQLWTWLIATIVMSVAAMVIGASAANQALAVLAGAMFTLVAALIGWLFAVRVKAGDAAGPVSARFARLIGAAWAWAGAGMLGCYYLTDLSWQHAWQYGLAMLLISGALQQYAVLREDSAAVVSGEGPVRTARLLTMLQAVAALAGVVMLAMSGKLEANGRDWAANIVFVAGGLAIFSLSMAALRAEKRALDG